MARITDEQLKNLSDCLQNLVRQYNVSNPYLAKQLGIPQSTLESYLYGLKAPRIQNLQKLSEFFGVSIDGLLANDVSLAAPKISSSEAYKNEVAESFESPIEYVTRYISTHYSKTHSSFVELLSKCDITITYRPIISEEEIESASAKIVALDMQEEYSLYDNIPESDNHTTFKKLDLLTSPNIQKLRELFDADLGTNSEKQIAFEIFYNHLLSGDYDKLDLDAFPLDIELTKVSLAKVKNIQKADSLNDLLSSKVTYSLTEFIDIEEEYLDTLINNIFK